RETMQHGFLTGCIQFENDSTPFGRTCADGSVDPARAGSAVQITCCVPDQSGLRVCPICTKGEPCSIPSTLHPARDTGVRATVKGLVSLRRNVSMHQLLSHKEAHFPSSVPGNSGCRFSLPDSPDRAGGARNATGEPSFASLARVGTTDRCLMNVEPNILFAVHEGCSFRRS